MLKLLKKLFTKKGNIIKPDVMGSKKCGFVKPNGHQITQAMLQNMGKDTGLKWQINFLQNLDGDNW